MREDSRKPPMPLDYHDKLCLLSLDEFVRLSSSSWSQIDDIKTSRTDPEMTELIIGKLCHNAWELLTANSLK